MNTCLKKFVSEKFKNPGRALDLGAGEFFDVACLKQLGWQCEGVDLTMGVDLEKHYLSKNRPFDLVYSNYVLHKLKNKEQLLRTVYDNLKNEGWFFMHTFDKSDTNSKSKLTASALQKLLKSLNFKNTEVRVFSYYDNDDGHKHWHKILEAIGQK